MDITISTMNDSRTSEESEVRQSPGLTLFTTMVDAESILEANARAKRMFRTE